MPMSGTVPTVDFRAACPGCGQDAHWHGRQVNANGTEYVLDGCGCPEMDIAHQPEP